MIIVVGTKSALKIRAVEKAIQKLIEHDITKMGDLPLSPYELRSEETESGIPAQPFGFDEMFTGALNRARLAREAHNAEIGIGIENGLVQIDGRWFDPPAVAIVYPRWQIQGRSVGAGLPIPTWMVTEVQEQKTEIGTIIQRCAGGGEKDPHKYLSKGILDRESIITQAVLSAFTVLISPDEYRVFNPND